MTNYILKPCPFCGGEAHVDHDTKHFEYIEMEINSYVLCNECGARTEKIDTSANYSSTEIAVEAWNRRVKNDNVICRSI